MVGKDDNKGQKMVKNMETVKIGLISPNLGFIRAAKQVAGDLGYHIETALAYPEDLPREAQKMEERGVEVLVSRRGTACFLQKILKLKLPVLSVLLTSFDLFCDIRRAKLFGTRMLIPTLHHKIEEIDKIQKMLNVEIICASFKTQNELEQIIQQGKKDGCQVAIGGEHCIKIARRYGLHGVEIRTSPEGIAVAFKDAESIALSRREERARSQLYRTIIDTMSCGIVAVDRKGYITAVNLMAKSSLNLNNKSLEGCHIRDVSSLETILESMDSERPLLHEIGTVSKDRLVLNYLPVKVDSNVVGGIITFRSLSNVMRSEREVRQNLTKRMVAKYTIEEFAYGDSKSKKIIRNIKEFAPNDSTVLIMGPTGTGKEIVASSIHNLSLRRDGPFVSVNCCSLPEQLLESELFGYEEGAFTGSRRGGKPGLFELAHKGTIFLDEIGGTPLNLQSSLLRILQEREVRRIGGDCFIPIDIRVIAATNLDLSREVAEGRFREDLFYRLNVLIIHIPALKDRLEDIPELVNRLLNRIASEHSLPPFQIPVNFIDRLCRLSWPGNVRQLANFLERLSILSKGDFSPQIFQELYEEIRLHSEIQEHKLTGEKKCEDTDLKFNSKIEEFRLIRQVLEEMDYDKGLAAERLGVSRTTLWRKIKAMQSIEK